MMNGLKYYLKQEKAQLFSNNVAALQTTSPLYKRRHWEDIRDNSDFKIEGQRRRQRQPEAIDFTRSAEFAYSRRCDAASRTWEREVWRCGWLYFDKLLSSLQARTVTAGNKQLNFTVKNKPHTTNYIYCIFEAYFRIKSVWKNCIDCFEVILE